MKIFIVDRSDNNFDNTIELLTNNGFETTFFNKVSDFQKTLKNSRPDLVICNPLIEGMSPFFIVKWIKELDKSIPVIVFSNVPSKDIIVSAKKFAVNGFILFPFNEHELITRINQLLNIQSSESNTSSPNKMKLHLEIIRKERITNEISITIEKLPSFPNVIYEIERLIGSPNSNASDFEIIIEKDQVITAKILKIINSPFYSLSRKITTIKESVAYMGLDSLRSIVYSASVSNLLKISLPTYGYKREQLWRHSYTTAILSKIIAQRLKLSQKESEEVFVGGLIHDIGKIVIGIIAKRENIILAASDDTINIIDKESEKFYFDHCSIGGMISDKWKLPDIHKQIIVSHHSPESLYPFIVAVADFISKDFLDIKLSPLSDDLKQQYLNKLKLTDTDILNLKESLSEIISKMDVDGIFA